MSYVVDKENRKLYGVVAIFVLLGIILVGVSYVGINVQTGIRGYVSGEAEWSKAQKIGTISLMRYINTGDPAYYEEFDHSLRVIRGNLEAREALSGVEVNIDDAKKGFLKANSHPNDVSAMIWVLLKFQDLEQIQKAIQIWKMGDTRIDQIVHLGEIVHQLIQERPLSESEIEEFNRLLAEYDDELTELEQQFSNAMNSAGRWIGEKVFWSTNILSVLLILLAALTSVSFMRSYRTTNSRLKESEQKFKNVLDQSRDVIYQINIGAETYDYMSTSVKDMLGFSAKEIMAGGPSFILERTHPEDIRRMEKKIKQLESDEVEKKVVQDSEFRVKRADGTFIWVNNKRSLLKDKEGKPYAIVGNVRDITVQKRQMEKLDKSLIEKQTLLAEIHHRVKNNLAIVSSLIELQKDGVDPRLKSSFRDIQSRIKSIALIHEKLYENTIFSEVELSSYVRELSGMISHTYHSNQKKVDIIFDLEDVKVDMTTAVPIGLICNELINNCFKHAFNELTNGEITITMRNKGDFISVEVADDGIGLPEGFDLGNTNGLGITLLNVLTDQVRGEMSVHSGKRTSFKLLFPRDTENQKAEAQSA